LEQLLGDGSRLGISLSYAAQPMSAALAQALFLRRGFTGCLQVSLIRGDNIFFGYGIEGTLASAAAREQGATLFAYSVSDPECDGVVDFDGDVRALSLEEKVTSPKSNFAVTGLCFYDQQVTVIAADLAPVRWKLPT
jgi:glucose-1-phosphate thymidylyltransferase